MGIDYNCCLPFQFWIGRLYRSWTVGSHSQSMGNHLLLHYSPSSFFLLLCRLFVFSGNKQTSDSAHWKPLSLATQCTSTSQVFRFSPFFSFFYFCLLVSIYIFFSQKKLLNSLIYFFYYYLFIIKTQHKILNFFLPPTKIRIRFNFYITNIKGSIFFQKILLI